MRKPLIAGNWKMHTTLSEAVDLVAALKALTLDGRADVLVCPPFVSLAAVVEKAKGTSIAVGAQNMYFEESGAFTGEVAPSMLTSIGCSHVIIGHSERRQLFGETDATVNKKVLAALAHGLVPVVCVGESEAQRDAGETASHIESQVKSAFAGIDSSQAQGMVVAYEPIWAIGTGKTATKEQAQEVCAAIRLTIAALYGASVADAVRVLYGGSVKPSNITDLMAEADIDGALVGGASLSADDFGKIINF